jgi:hypothetical protein
MSGLERIQRFAKSCQEWAILGIFSFLKNVLGTLGQLLQLSQKWIASKIDQILDFQNLVKRAS